MYVACVSIWLKPGFEEAFLEASRKNHEGTRREPGNLRFDVLRHEDDPLRFLLYEVYRTKEDLAVHQKTAHYLAWKETAADWMAQPRQGVKYWSLFPDDSPGAW
jgi:autoinducer 2-degrading protein